RADADDRRLLPLRPAWRLRDGGRARGGRVRAGDGRRARLLAAPDAMTRLLGRAAAPAVAAFVVVGPLASLVVWSLAERWTTGSAWPQRFGLRYWARLGSADFLEPLGTGVMGEN